MRPEAIEVDQLLGWPQNLPGFLDGPLSGVHLPRQWVDNSIAIATVSVTILGSLATSFHSALERHFDMPMAAASGGEAAPWAAVALATVGLMTVVARGFFGLQIATRAKEAENVVKADRARTGWQAIQTLCELNDEECYFMADPSGRVVTITGAWAGETGVANPTGTSWLEAISFPERGRVADEWALAVKHGTRHSSTFGLEHRPGRQVKMSVAPVYDDDGHVLYFLGRLRFVDVPAGQTIHGVQNRAPESPEDPSGLEG